MGQCFAGQAGSHFRASRCQWRSVDGYGCNFEVGHVGWHERHIRPDCECATFVPSYIATRAVDGPMFSPFTRRALVGTLPAKVIR